MNTSNPIPQSKFNLRTAFHALTTAAAALSLIPAVPSIAKYIALASAVISGALHFITILDPSAAE